MRAEDVVPRLLGRDLLTPADVVGAGVEVRPLQSRNHTFAVHCGGRVRYIVKSAGPRSAVTLRHEALVHAALGALRATPAGDHGRVAHWDPGDRVLILRALDGHDLDRRAARVGVSAPLAAAIGRLLGTTHAAELRTSLRPPAAPAAFSLCSPPVGLLADLSYAAVDVVRTLQTSCAAELAALGEQWLDPPALAFCHNDVRWSNVILLAGPPGRRPLVGLVDWELGGWADPAWDLGAVFGWLLSRWPTAAASLESVQRAVVACWRGYRPAGAGPRDGDLLPRAVRYAAVRLIQSVYEHAQVGTRLDGGDLQLLQLAANILARPREAAVHLLGLQVGEAHGR